MQQVGWVVGQQGLGQNQKGRTTGTKEQKELDTPTQAVNQVLWPSA
jgi:hypothetical protein